MSAILSAERAWNARRTAGGKVRAGASPLEFARTRRRLTLEEAAARARLEVEDVRSLEQGRIWRFRSVEDALAASLVYAASLGISEREARRLAGLPAVPSRRGGWIPRRAIAVLAFALAAATLLWSTAVPHVLPMEEPAPPAPPVPAVKEATPPLPEPWEIQVDVLNGTPRGNAAAGLANEIAGLAYSIGAVKNAPRSDYRETLVYYPPGAEAIAERLAGRLGVGTAALPGGDNPRRLVVIVGARP